MLFQFYYGFGTILINLLIEFIRLGSYLREDKNTDVQK